MPLIFNLNEECLSLKSIKVQFWDLTVLILEKHFPGFVWSFFKKPAKKVKFSSKQDKLYQNFGHFNQKKMKFSLFKQNLIIHYNHIKYSTSF